MIPMGLHELEVGSDVGPHPVQCAAGRVHLLLDEFRGLAQQARQDLFQEFALTGEVVRDDALADAGLAGDLRQRRAGVPARGDRADRRVDDLPSTGLFDEGRSALAIEPRI